MKKGRREFVITAGATIAYALLPSQKVWRCRHVRINWQNARRRRQERRAYQNIARWRFRHARLFELHRCKRSFRQERNLDHRGLGQQGKSLRFVKTSFCTGSHSKGKTNNSRFWGEFCYRTSGRSRFAKKIEPTYSHFSLKPCNLKS